MPIMQTLIFNGSPRPHGDTMALIAELQKHLQGETMLVSAYRSDISPCIDCRSCWQHEGCAIDDGMQEVYRAIESCDNIIIASPLHFSELSGPLLALLSRLQLYWVGRFFKDQPFPGRLKNGALLLAGGGDGSPDRAKATARTLFKHMHCRCIGSVLSLATNERAAADDAQALTEVRELAEQLNRLYAERREQPAEKALPGRGIDPETLALWCSLVMESTPPGFIEQIISAAADPQSFFIQHPDTMRELGIEGPFAEIYRYMIVHELEAQRKLITLDWKSPLDDIDWVIGTLSDGAQANLLCDRSEDEETHALLCLAGERLLQRGQTLLFLDTASDSYPLMLIGKEQAEQCIRLGQLCGLQIMVMRED